MDVLPPPRLRKRPGLQARAFTPEHHLTMPPATKPYFRFVHSRALRAQTLEILDAIDTEPDPCLHRAALANHIVVLTESGFQFFFLDPITKLKMGFIVEQSAGLGVSSVVRILSPIVNNIVARMDKKQLRQASRIMRDMMK